jgi:hypothetical protein
MITIIQWALVMETQIIINQIVMVNMHNNKIIIFHHNTKKANILHLHWFGHSIKNLSTQLKLAYQPYIHHQYTFLKNALLLYIKNLFIFLKFTNLVPFSLKFTRLVAFKLLKNQSRNIILIDF